MTPKRIKSLRVYCNNPVINYDYLLNECLDEIERLQAEVERLKDDIARRDSEADLAIVEGGK